MKNIILLFMAMNSSIFAKDIFISADDQRLSYSDFVRISMQDSPCGNGVKMARFDRISGPASTGYSFDNPGARLRFRTDAQVITVHLFYNDRHVSKTARNPNGIYLIDGKHDPKWSFSTEEKNIVRKAEKVDVKIDIPPDRSAHDYDIVMPYGDSVDILGVTVDSSAKFVTPAPRPDFICTVYGDSVSQGFTASDIGKTYAFRLGELRNWQIVNTATGGRSSSAKDGAELADIKCSMLLVLIGVNDWQGGKPLGVYKRNIMGFIKNFRQKQPDTPMCFVAPLWVSPSWKPPKVTSTLEEYRKVLRDAVAASGYDGIKVIEGTDLIDHKTECFDRIAVHPNDTGFHVMTERLGIAMP